MFYFSIILVIILCVRLASSVNTTTVASDYYVEPAGESNYDDDIMALLFTNKKYNPKVRPVAQVGLQIKVIYYIEFFKKKIKFIYFF
jgi:hypothetical protein